MVFQDIPIKRKLTGVIMLTTILVLVLTSAAFMLYGLFAFKKTLVRNLQITANILADNSTAALTFKNEKEAHETLASVHADSHITAAALYDVQNELYVWHPPHASIEDFPSAPGSPGIPHFSNGSV